MEMTLLNMIHKSVTGSTNQGGKIRMTALCMPTVHWQNSLIALCEVQAYVYDAKKAQQRWQSALGHTTTAKSSSEKQACKN